MENVKIVSAIKSREMDYDFISKSSKLTPHFEYRIKLADKIADYIRRNTNISRKYMIYPDSGYYLDDENIVTFSFIAEPKECDRINSMFIETVERISNQGDEDYFISHLLTSNGEHKFPADIHAQMHKEFGLYDISEDEFENCIEAELEWNVAHFFIHLTILLFDPG